MQSARVQERMPWPEVALLVGLVAVGFLFDHLFPGEED